MLYRAKLSFMNNSNKKAKTKRKRTVNNTGLNTNNSSNDEKQQSKKIDNKQSETSSCSTSSRCSTREISDLLHNANSVLYDQMASYTLPTTDSTPHGVSGIPQVPQVNFGTATQLNSSPIVYGQGSVQLQAGVVDGVMREVLSKLNSIDTKLAKLDTIENSLFQVTRRVSDIECSMEQLRNNFTTEFETLKKDKIELKKDIKEMADALNEISLITSDDGLLGEIEHLKSAVGINTEKMLELHSRSMRENLVFRPRRYRNGFKRLNFFYEV